jgi:hypothetical protein
MSAGEAGVAPQAGKQLSEAAGLLSELLALLPPPAAQTPAVADRAPAADLTPALAGSGSEDPRHLQPWPGFSGAVFGAWRQLLRLAAAQPDAAGGDEGVEPPAPKRQRVDVSGSGDISSGSDARHGSSAACSAAHIAVLQCAGAETGLPTTAPEAGADSVTEAREGATAVGAAVAQPLQPAAAAIAAAAAQCMALAARHLKVCCGTRPGCMCTCQELSSYQRHKHCMVNQA